MNWFARLKRSRPLANWQHAELRRPQAIENGPPLERKSAVGIWLTGVDLSGADLRWADLRYADLSRANLRGALLDHADLSWSSLRGAHLDDAVIGSCRFVEADLTEADVGGADFSRVIGLTWANVRRVRNGPKASWPTGFGPAWPAVVEPLQLSQ